MNLDRVLWATWWVGMILFVGNLVKVIPYKIGRVGFFLVIAAILIRAVSDGYWRVPPKTKDEENNDEENIANS